MRQYMSGIQLACVQVRNYDLMTAHQVSDIRYEISYQDQDQDQDWDRRGREKGKGKRVKGGSE